MLQQKVFAEGVAKDIKKYFPPDYSDMECEVMEKRKNNGIVLTGICFQRPGKQVSPIVYVEPFYQEMCKGKPMEDVLGKIAETAQAAMEAGRFPKLPDVGNYDKVKEYLGVKIVNTRANRKELPGIPHRNTEDLSLVPVLKFPLPEQGAYGSSKISNEMMEHWGVDVDTLIGQAWENEEKGDPPVLRGLGEYMGETVFGCRTENNLLNAQNPASGRADETVYMLSNRSRINGAVYFASPETMEKVSVVFPEGFFIVPSSVHEILIVPKDKDVQEVERIPKEMGRLLRNINQSYVERDEILSDRIYEYDKESGKIRQVPESMKKERGMDR